MNERTYYLGLDGRVSQRKHLVGMVIATTRANYTAEAAYKFQRPLPIRIAIRPFVKSRRKNVTL